MEVAVDWLPALSSGLHAQQILSLWISFAFCWSREAWSSMPPVLQGAGLLFPPPAAPEVHPSPPCGRPGYGGGDRQRGTGLCSGRVEAVFRPTGSASPAPPVSAGTAARLSPPWWCWGQAGAPPAGGWADWMPSAPSFPVRLPHLEPRRMWPPPPLPLPPHWRDAGPSAGLSPG